MRADLGPHRANKTDFVRIRAAVADVDPDDDATKQPGGLLREQQRIRTEGEAREDDPRTRPSFVVASGRGEQVGYVFREPIPAHEHQDRFERLMRGVLLALGTDTSTHDIGRLVRPPYGVNYPNARKLKQGHSKPVPTGLAFESETRWTLEDLEAIYPPIAEAKTKSKSVREAEIVAVDLDYGAVLGTPTYDDLPAELRAKFEKDRSEDGALDELWNGDVSATGGNDSSGSGFSFQLARCLRRTGRYTATEFGQIVHGWPHGRNLSELNESDAIRQLKRDWSRNKGESPGDVFEDTTSGDMASDTTAKPDPNAWGEPADLWDCEGAPTLFPDGVVPPFIHRFATDCARRIGVSAGAVAAIAVAAFGSLGRAAINSRCSSTARNGRHIRSCGKRS